MRSYFCCLLLLAMCACDTESAPGSSPDDGVGLDASIQLDVYVPPPLDMGSDMAPLGMFGDPCEESRDCHSGYCIEAPEGGRISIQARREDGRVAVRIEDTGTGMSNEEQGRIFDRFYRGAKSHSRETGGVGIGLSIVRRIVDLHGGRINVRSKLGQGSTFEVMLPAAS